MDQTKTLKAIGLLQLAYPSDLPKERLQLYVTMLSDIPPAALAAAVNYCINHSRFLPTIAEIREAAEQGIRFAAGTQTLGSNEAWKHVLRAIASVGYTGQPEFDDPVLQRTVERLGWQEICLTPVEDTAILRAQFRRAYEQEVSQQQTIRDYAKAGVPIAQKYVDALAEPIKELAGKMQMSKKS